VGESKNAACAGTQAALSRSRKLLRVRYTTGAGMSQHIKIVRTTVEPSMKVILFIFFIYCGVRICQTGFLYF
jgi:hypothetical protein